MMLKVIEVVLQSLQHLLHRVGVAVVESGITCHAWAHLVELFVAVVVLHDPVNEILSLRTIADERHVADQNIPQLWQLVKMVIA